MDIRKLQRAIVDGLEDVKAQNIAVFNTEHLSPLFERVIIASGNSNRQTKALASSVREAVKARGMQVLRTEGEDNGEWIIVDCGAAVAHIMQPAIRDYYHLEEIWGGKNVKMKLGEGKGGLVKASEPEPERKAAKLAKGAANKGATGTARAASKPAPTGGRAPARPAAKPSAKPAPKSTAKPAAKPAPKPGAKPVARAATQTVVVAPTRKATAQTAARPAARKAAAVPARPAARKTAAAKAPARKAAPKTAAKAPARKTAAARPPARKTPPRSR